jgi:hypothetical protein
MFGCQSFVRHFTDGGYTKTRLTCEVFETKITLIKYKPKRQMMFMLMGQGWKESNVPSVPD